MSAAGEGTGGETGSRGGLLLESLLHFWRINLAIVAAVAVCTAVLVGALLVGDSMRGSLRALTLERLGDIDHVVVAESFLRQDLAEELEEQDGFGERFADVVPALLLQGSVSVPQSGRRAAQVGIQGIDDDFASLFPGYEDRFDLERVDGQLFGSALVNATLARELAAEVGDELLIALQRPSDVPRESLMGSTDPADVVQTMRVVVRGVLEDRGPGRFGLLPHQTLPSNVFVPLRDLQRSLDQRARVNALLVSGAPEAAGELAERLAQAAQLEDYGLEVAVDEEVARVTAREVVLRPPLEEYLLAVAEEEGWRRLPVSTYLANQVRIVDPAADRSLPRPLLPYSTIAALPGDLPSLPDVFGGLRLLDGSPAPALDEEQVLLNAWAAEDLGAVPGDRLEIEYWEVGDSEELRARTVRLELAGIVALDSLGAAAELTPEFPGVSDADDMSEWDPTFPVDLSLIEQRDEDYWDLYRGAPKIFVAEALGRRLWGNRFGELSALWLAPAGGAGDNGREASARQVEARLGERLPAELPLARAGVSVRGVKSSGLEAARGATDFAGLFIGFSLFLIVASALLVALFFRLGTERRGREIGALLAYGTPLPTVRRRLLVEALVLSLIGVAIGLGLALAYAALMMWGLGTVWVGAIGARFLELHVAPLSLFGGALGALALVSVVLWRTVRQLAGLAPVSLLRGEVTSDAEVLREARWSRRVFWLSALAALGLLALSFAVPEGSAGPVFVGLGAALLVCGLAALAVRLRRGERQLITDGGPGGLVRMALANVGLVPGRSLLSVALVASATFVIVAVGAYGHRFGHEDERDSGAGGFDLRATADVPVYEDLTSADGRFDLGFSQEQSELLAGAEIYGLRVVPGDDVSCLNLYQPTSPRLLGISPELRQRGGFSFQQLVDLPGAEEDPWSLLEGRLEDGAIPAFGDFNSVMWILKSGLGQDVVIENERGEPLRLRLVGLLRRSIFQSELLVAEEILAEEFPSRGGARDFLLDVAPGQAEKVAATLEQGLERFGFDSRSTTQVLESFQAVENTYLSTFQVLGGLGLLLGTLGLAVVLLRGVLERSAELATLQAVGFARRKLGWTVLAENAVLLLLGVLLGATAALVAVAPHLLGGQALVPWASLALTLVAVVAVGTLASAAAVRHVVRLPLLGALRGD
ncbi:MAG: ABC transporter permease [Acidobacteria bacterium]|nr:MAG: ABC transporter permease [Acidobacteriota bacterium]